jgi:hypothetical protein
MSYPPPYAEVQISLNGLTPATGAVTANPGDNVQLSGVSIVGWTAQRWEIYDYPPDWTAPTGWDTDSDGTIYSTDVTPDDFDLPALDVAWGKWMFRLRINGAVTGSDSSDRYTDDSACLETLSVNGLHDLGAKEDDQWDPLRGWAGHQKTNLRTFAFAVPIVGAGDPEGSVAAPVPSLYLRTDGGTGSTLYVKETGGTGSTGWTAK